MDPTKAHSGLLWLGVAVIAVAIVLLAAGLSMWLMTARGPEGTAAIVGSPTVLILLAALLHNGNRGRLDDRKYAVLMIAVAFLTGTLALGALAYRLSPEWAVLTLGVAHPERAWVAFTSATVAFGLAGWPAARRVAWLDLIRQRDPDDRAPIASRGRIRSRVDR